MTQNQKNIASGGETMDDLFGPCISEYSRAQAIEDGVLIDVTETAKEAGFKFPVALTAGVYGALNIENQAEGQSFQGRLWDLLFIMRVACKSTQGERVDFEVLLHRCGRGKFKEKFYALIGPGDTAAPVITIMLPGED